jgi:hypothetical protein
VAQIRSATFSPIDSVFHAASLNKCAEPNIIKMAKQREDGVVNASLYAKHTSREEQRKADAKTVKKQGAHCARARASLWSNSRPSPSPSSLLRVSAFRALLLQTIQLL